MNTYNFDLVIIGGGINGTGIARDAAGRGLNVLLLEKDDLGQHTSSASTKLIHGGLRYLEYYEFRLVREALQERERLLNLAPHIISPLTFVLPHQYSVRPAWMIRLGLFLYDHLASHPKLPNSKLISLKDSPFGQPLQKNIKKAFTYADCSVDDSRLVILNAKDACRLGANILTHTKLIEATRSSNDWEITYKNNNTQETTRVRAKIVINAAGPWVMNVLQNNLMIKSKMNVKLVKGSHIIVPKFFEGNQAYILQNQDRRIVFAIPYYDEFTLVGTTDISWEQSPDQEPKIDQNEIEYLCNSINHYFKKTISAQDIIWDYSGIRPLYDDSSSNASAVTRDYHLDFNDEANQAPILSVFGGKITTYRRLAEHCLEKISSYFPDLGNAWTAQTPLPGGDFENRDFSAFYHEFYQEFPYLDKTTSLRIAHAYGSEARILLKQISNLKEMGLQFGHGLSQCEVDFLVNTEWANTVDDILWRRTKLGLYFNQEEKENLRQYLQKSF